MSQTEHHLGEELFAMAAGELDPKSELAIHAAGCAACQRAIAEARAVFEGLDAKGLEPSAGFDAALFSKLDALEADKVKPISRRWAWVAPIAIAAGIGAFALRPKDEPAAELYAFEPEVLEVAEDLELYQNLDVIEDLDVIDDLDAIAIVDEGGSG